jgi:hypothetical protein
MLNHTVYFISYITPIAVRPYIKNTVNQFGGHITALKSLHYHAS